MFQQRCWHSLTPKCRQTGILCFLEVLGCFALCFAAAEAIYGSTCVYGVYTPCQHNLLIKMTSRVHPSVLGLRSGGQVLISCVICWRFPCCVPRRGSGAQCRSELGQIELHHLLGLSRASLGPCQRGWGLFKVERRERPSGGGRLESGNRKEGIRLADSEQMWAGVLCWVCSTAEQQDCSAQLQGVVS